MKHFKIKKGKVRKIETVSSPLGECCLEVVSLEVLALRQENVCTKFPASLNMTFKTS